MARPEERADRRAAEPAPALSGGGDARLRPRVFTVERRKPRRRDLRVLRRLTWTEADGFAQYEKLLAAFSYADWAEEHFNNRALFSDYYLLERLREFPEWGEDPKPTYLALRQLYVNVRARLAGKSNEDLISSLVEPVALGLGFHCRRGKVPPTHDEPDFRLFAPGGSEPLALLLAYPWDRSLDGKDDLRDVAFKDENPGAIVVSLLAREEAPWVILTNGRLWRLYARQTHSRATNYYELDAEELLADTGVPLTDPGEAFRYFWLLFRRQAFERHPAQREGKTVELSLLDRLLLESEDYARELGSRLKGRVFEDGGDAAQHYWRYFDLKAREVLDNRYLIANLISADPNTPRVVEAGALQGVFGIQEQVIADILRSSAERQAMEVVPRTIDSVQQTVATAIQGYLNHPEIDRGEAIELIRFLNQPMLGVQIKELRAALRAFKAAGQVKELMETVRKLRSAIMEPTEPTYDVGSRRALQREDLRLICFEFVNGS